VSLGVAGLGYQWKKDGVVLDGKTEPTLSLFNVTSADAGSYTVVVTSDSCGSVESDPATLILNNGVEILDQPPNRTVCPGKSTGFAVRASGVGLSYQWRKNDQDIPGATDVSVAIFNATRADEGIYVVVVSGMCGSATSLPATLTFDRSVQILNQPLGQTACVGGSATFSVNATGVGALTYRWKRNGTDIPGAVSSTYTVSNVRPEDDGTTYTVVVGPCGSDVSSNARLTVGAGNVTVDDASACAGGSVVLRANVSGGSGNYSYAWSTGQSGPSITVSPAATSTYVVTVTDNSGVGCRPRRRRCRAASTGTVAGRA
jgi:hypothetical protein